MAQASALIKAWNAARPDMEDWFASARQDGVLNGVSFATVQRLIAHRANTSSAYYDRQVLAKSDGATRIAPEDLETLADCVGDSGLEALFAGQDDDGRIARGLEILGLGKDELIDQYLPSRFMDDVSYMGLWSLVIEHAVAQYDPKSEQFKQAGFLAATRGSHSALLKQLHVLWQRADPVEQILFFASDLYRVYTAELLYLYAALADLDARLKAHGKPVYLSLGQDVRYSPELDFYFLRPMQRLVTGNVGAYLAALMNVQTRAPYYAHPWSTEDVIRYLRLHALPASTLAIVGALDNAFGNTAPLTFPYNTDAKKQAGEKEEAKEEEEDEEDYVDFDD